jgi:hypothetical protein
MKDIQLAQNQCVVEDSFVLVGETYQEIDEEFVIVEKKKKKLPLAQHGVQTCDWFYRSVQKRLNT